MMLRIIISFSLYCWFSDLPKTEVAVLFLQEQLIISVWGKLELAA